MIPIGYLLGINFFYKNEMRWGILENETPMPMGVPLHLQVGTISIYYWGAGGGGLSKP